MNACAESKIRRNKKKEEHELKMMYERDQNRYREIMNLSLTRTKEHNDEVRIKLEDFDRKMVASTTQKQNKMKEVSKFATEHVKHVMDKLDVIKNKNPEEEMDYTLLASKFQKKINCAKKRDETLRRRKKEYFEKTRDEQFRVQSLLQTRNKELAERNKHLIQKVKDKDMVAKKKNKAMEQDMMIRHEINRLKRENQLYNMKREQAIIGDYKKQLIKKLKEKPKLNISTANISPVYN